MTDQVVVNGWIHKKPKKIGKNLVFCTLRDPDGNTIQLVDNNTPSIIRSLKQESAVSITGHLKPKVSSNTSSEENDGTVIWDLAVDSASVLNEASVLGSQLFSTLSATKEWPAKYRYLQLRTPEFQRMFRLRAQVMRECRSALDEIGFCEIDTPLLFKSTPEGAREFLVPTRKKGLVYALPQSPQQYKQLLMASGVNKYYQIAKCFRDEDLRADRQPEFTQLDLEMSFANGKDVQKVVERVIINVWEKAAKRTIFTLDSDMRSLVPVKDSSANESQLAHLSYDDAIDRFGIDKPDIRSSLEIINITNTGLATAIENPEFPIFEMMIVRGGHDADPHLAKQLANPEHYKTRIPRVIAIKDDSLVESWPEKFKSLAVFGQDNDPETLTRLKQNLKVKKGDIVVGSTRAAFCYENPTPLGRLRQVAIQNTLPKGLYQREIRTDLAGIAEIIGENKSVVGADDFAAIWVDQFPLFNPVETEKDTVAEKQERELYPSYDKTQYVSTHHPFTMLSLKDYSLLSTSPLSVRGQHYDFVMNGVELGGGSTRIHDVALQRYIFDHILGIKNSEELFGHLLDAFGTGCPPHAGLAIGFDRMVAMIAGKESIRDVIAFPKTATGADPMIGSPSEVTEGQIKNYHMKVVE